MKKLISMILLCLMISAFFAGCGKQAIDQGPSTQGVAIGNPWSDWDSLEEAEEAVGFSLGLPVVVGQYEAVVFRTMSKELLEIIYRYEDFEICVRKLAGEGQDISGDYTEYETCTETEYRGATVISYQNSGNPATRQTISFQGYSWSLVAPNGYWENSNQDFLNGILK